MDAVVAISLIRMAAADLAMEPWQRPQDAYPNALQPIVDLARALDLPNDQPPDQQHIRDRATSAARDFLATEAHQNHSL
ncbi:hypothetical protein [Streptomyces sp. NPDC091209]|uniref:hypothetical protein n=1 Tax=Streptomyces sp. NPDC091209 TaxID=3365974 RepID=UPI0037FC2773